MGSGPCSFPQHVLVNTAKDDGSTTDFFSFDRRTVDFGILYRSQKFPTTMEQLHCVQTIFFMLENSGRVCRPSGYGQRMVAVVQNKLFCLKLQTILVLF